MPLLARLATFESIACRWDSGSSPAALKNENARGGGLDSPFRVRLFADAELDGSASSSGLRNVRSAQTSHSTLTVAPAAAYGTRLPVTALPSTLSLALPPEPEFLTLIT